MLEVRAMILKAIACVASIFLPSIAVAQSAAPSTPAVAQTNRVKIEYVPPTNPAHQPLLDLLKRRHVLERVQTLLSPFRLPVIYWYA
jgi:hypothetical protein